MRPAHLLVTLAASVAIATPIAAQQFVAPPTPSIFSGLEHPIAVADLNSDGLVDLVAGTRHWLQQAGASGYRFAELTNPLGTATPTGSALIDVDADGDVDWVAVFDGPTRLLLNDGTGNFTDVSAAQLPADNDASTDVIAIDVDGDSDSDLVIANSTNPGQQNRLYLNDGSGQFSDATATHLPQRADRTSVIAAGDIDGDGDTDLVFGGRHGDGGNPGNLDRILLNDGSGVFVDPVSPLLPTQFFPTIDIALGDIDGDTDLDLIASGLLLGSFGAPVSWVFENDGTGSFLDVTATNLPEPLYPFPVALGDLDGDGDLDLLAESIRRNDGNGVFSTLPDGEIGSGALADFDGDGDLDMATVLGMFTNDGTGNPTPRTYPTQVDSDISISFDDVNSDSIFDIEFSSTRLANVAAYLGGTTAIDLDGDGDDDFLRVNWDGSHTTWFQDSNPIWLGATVPGGAPFPFQNPPYASPIIALDTGDVDGDGDTDFVVSSSIRSVLSCGTPCGGSWPVSLFVNDGTGSFSLVALPASPNPVSGVELGDLDGDGDLDLVLGTGAECCHAQNRAYINDGTGSFTDQTATHLPFEGFPTAAIDLGDVDGDGDLDLLVQNFADMWTPTPPTQLYLNDGTGVFTHAAPTAIPPIATVSPFFPQPEIRLIDLDGDGDLDALGDIFAENDGSGAFTDATMALLGTALTPYGVFVDVDLDGDLDFLPRSSADQPLVNLRQHLEPLERIRVGATYSFRIHARSRPASVTMSVPMIGFLPAHIALPSGALGIDPQFAVLLPSAVVPPATTFVDTTISVPTDTNLIGLEIFTQALIARFQPGQPAEIGVSNVLFDTARDPWIE